MTMIKKFKKNNKNNYSAGFTIVELIIVVGMISTFSGLMLPSFLNWIRTEKVNSYTRELREYFRVVRLEARRWGSSCVINTNDIAYDSAPVGENLYGYTVNCDSGSTNINSLAPAINNSIFQVTNKDFRITPNGRISSNKSIVIVIGSKYHNKGSKILNCLIIQSPTGHILKGKFSDNNWITNSINISQIYDDNIITKDKCNSL